MKLLIFIILILGFIVTSKSQNLKLAGDTAMLYNLEIAKGTVEHVKKEAERFKSKFPTIQTRLVFKTPNFVLITNPCESKEKMEKLKEELIKDFPALKFKKCIEKN
jgi:histidinol-phosphate/aromatic aminotransferase/cobyric acid decarboxylase-like protein